VEDNLVNQRVMQKQLKNLGCVVYTVSTASVMSVVDWLLTPSA